MSVFTVPEDVASLSLGPLVALWMEQNLVHGKGDVGGDPYRLDAEKKALLSRMYELQPDGRRRFKRVGISVRKGWAKTEFAAGTAAAELHPLAPVRFAGFAKGGEPTGLDLYPVYKRGDAMGIGVRDPYVPVLAFTEEQSDELCFGALLAMLEGSPLKDDFDLGLERIIVLGPNGEAVGKAVALASSPNARDGARTSFQVCDETHRWVLERLVKTHQTLLNNIPKRKAADAWTLEITTAYEPGLGSVAEKTMEYAKQIDAGKVKDSRLFFFHRQAADHFKLLEDGAEAPSADVLREAVIDASGMAASWSDIPSIVDLGLDPSQDLAYFDRVWLNRNVQQSQQAFPMGQIDKLVHNGFRPVRDAPITLGFDGAQTRDTTALVGTDIGLGRQFLFAVWENPGTEPGWRVPGDEVDKAVAQAFDAWDVKRMYCDPYYWDTHVASWVAQYMKHGSPRVYEWATNTGKKMALAIQAYISAMNEGKWSWDGAQVFRDHLANSRKKPIPMIDEYGVNCFTIRKERPDSPLKIDVAMAGCLSWQAYLDAVTAGETRKSAGVPVAIF